MARTEVILSCMLKAHEGCLPFIPCCPYLTKGRNDAKDRCFLVANYGKVFGTALILGPFQLLFIS